MWCKLQIKLLARGLYDSSNVLNFGWHLGFMWIVMHNGMGYRCGYVRVPAGHPWHSMHQNDIHYQMHIHGGLTYANHLVCGIGDGVSWWLGFDCAHAWDAPDPALPCELTSYRVYGEMINRGRIIRTQAYVEQECRNLCVYAAMVAGQVIPQQDDICRSD